MQLRLVFAGEVEENVLILGDLHDRSDGELGILGGLRVGVVHLEDRARDAVRAERGLLIHIHKHNVDVDHATHSLYMDMPTRNTSDPCGPRLEASGLLLTEQCSRPDRFLNLAQR